MHASRSEYKPKGPTEDATDLDATIVLEPLRQSRQEATYSGSTHWQRHRNTTGQPWPTASSHESAPHFRRVSVKTEFNSLGTDARRFNVGPSRRNLHTAAGNPHVITLQQGGEIHDPNVVKREPSESLIHPVKEETQEAVLTEASKPGVGAIETTPSSWKAEDTVDTDSQTVIVEPPSPSIILSAEQQEVLDMVKSGQNVFFTGSAGASYSACKSTCLMDAVHHARHRQVSSSERNHQGSPRRLVFGPSRYHCSDGYCGGKHRWMHTAFLGWNWPRKGIS